MNSDRPNILFLMVDQLRPDHAGFMPEARFKTPRLTELGERSTVFENCQSVNPVCMPARSSLLTGRYSRQINCLAMSGDLPRDLPMYPQALQRAGYWTGVTGKLHHLQTWPWSTPRGKGLDLANMAPDTKKLGFDLVVETAGKQLALKNRCHWCEHLEAKGILEEVRDYVEQAGANKNIPTDDLKGDGFAWPFDEEDHVDSFIGSQAIQALRTRPTDKPFFLHVSFCSPHKPFDPPQRYLDRVPEDETDDFIAGPDGETPSEDLKQTLYRLRRAYRATIHLLDDQIGRILDEVRDQGLLDNTLILFTSDHGEMMGDHFRVQKDIFWRQSLTVPTCVSLPGQREGHVNSSPVELTDLTATVLDAAGLDPEESLSEPWPAYRNVIPCRSLLPATGTDEAVREFSFSESRHGWQCVQSRHRKYVRSPGRKPGTFEELLLDVDSDPDERQDLSDRPEEGDALKHHRDYLNWLLATHPPAQTRWAPLPEG